MTSAPDISTAFEDSDFIAVDKPAGILTTPSRFPDKDQRPVLGLIIQQRLKIQLFPVHRLDFEVSGLVLFAKSARAHKLANAWFENRQVEKTYAALTEAKAEVPTSGAAFVWKNKIVRGKRRSFVADHGQPSETRACVTSVTTAQTVSQISWALFPKTGRPHQLRLHLSMHGFPILGDELYGSTRVFRTDEIALRSVELDFSKISERLGLPLKIQIAGIKDAE